MNTNIIEAVLHLREASHLLQDIHPELSFTLLRLVGAFVQTDEEMQQIHDMESMAANISEDSVADGTSISAENIEDTSDERAS